MSTSLKSVTAKKVAKARARGEQIAIADVRTFSEFDAVHAAGARNHPLDATDPQRMVASFGIPGLGAEVPLYLLCHTSRRAALAADRLVNAGYPNVVLIEGGTQAWEAEKLPVVRGAIPRVLPLPQQVQIAVGVLLLVKTLLGVTVHPVFFVLTAALGAGLIYAGMTQSCLMAQLLGRMPWNRMRTADRAA